MIIIKNKAELESMRKAGRIAAGALKIGGEAIKPGMTTKELNQIIHGYILSQNATPSFLGYNGFPASACISINDEVIHGIPGERKILDGDVVSIDVGAYFDGFHGDNAATFSCGAVSKEASELMLVTKECLELAVKAAVVGNRLGDISNAVETHAKEKGFGVITDYVGHGIGRDMHEDPPVPNYGPARRGPRLTEGMTIAIEPMICIGTGAVRVLEDDWTVVTKEGGVCAHYEYTVAITENGPEILTIV